MPDSAARKDDHNGGSSPTVRPKRSSTMGSVTHSISSFAEDIVLRHDPAPGFVAATAQAGSRAPSVGEIRRRVASGSGSGSSAGGGKQGSGSGSSAGRLRRPSGKGSRGSARQGSGHGGGDVSVLAASDALFAPLTEEPSRMSEDGGDADRRGLDDGRAAAAPRSDVWHVDRARRHPPGDETPGEATTDGPSSRYQPPTEKRTPTAIESSAAEDQLSRAYISDPTPTTRQPFLPATALALRTFYHWSSTPSGFLITLYGLNIVAWGGMLFLLLCNAAPAMCHAPIPAPSNRIKLSPAAALALPGPYYTNCNDINAPRRIWIEIDSQILNALFCVTGFGLVPWRFRDLYYLLRYRVAGSRRALRVLAGIHSGWFRLPGSDTLDALRSDTHQGHPDLERLASLPTHEDTDTRLPLPPSRTPPPPASGVRAPPTALWKLDFFIWCQVWNTFFQCGLCGFMWGQDRYERPPWSTGLFVALACGVAGAGGLVSFLEGRRVRRVEGEAAEGGMRGAQQMEGVVSAGAVEKGDGAPAGEKRGES